VWENLQRPFREEKARLARVAELDRERFIHEREVKDQVDAERARLAAEAETSRLRQTQEVELMTARAALEEARVSADLAQQRAQQQIDAERAKAELATLEAAVARARVDHDAKLERSQRELELEAARRTMQNDISDARLQELLVAAMPAIAEKLPRHAKSEVVTIGAGADPAAASLVSLVAALRAALAPRSTS
jgi:DNA segregation ATPase FtsK/SpoIIIE-like protein